MSLPALTEENTANVLSRKEYYQFKSGQHGHKSFPITDILLKSRFLLRAHQQFVRNFMNTNTPYTRLHLAHGTGLGKTMAALCIAMEFITTYQQIYKQKQTHEKNYQILDTITPTVYILAFAGAKKAFMGELLSRTTLGFISEAELEEFNIKRANKANGTQHAIDEYKSMARMLKKRITSKKLGGFFKFYGYEEFVNQLFYGKVTLGEIEKEMLKRYRADPNGANLDVLAEYIENKTIIVNHKLLLRMANSLVIADEIHDTYNSHVKNNRGLAIQYVLDNVPSVRFLSLSATPMNNSPTEIIDLLNYLVPSRKLRKADYFTTAGKITDDKLEELGKLSIGHYSYIRDSNIQYYPQRIMMGEPIVLPHAVGEMTGELPYLKFIPCEMSEIHQAAYFEHVRATLAGEVRIGPLPEDTDEIEEVAADTKSYVPIPIAGYSIYDMVLPGRDGGPPVFYSSDLKMADVTLKPQSDQRKLIQGEFLGEAQIGKYSAKYARLLGLLHEIIASAGGDPQKTQKCLIYHGTVVMSGVLLIQELLLRNGFLNEYLDPVETTLCMVCGQRKKTHGASTGCQFIPARFTTIYGGVDKQKMDTYITTWDSDDNLHGHKIMILIGSKVIKQSYDFKAVQNLIIASLPTNISTMIQVFGRCIRTMSHANLPPDQNHVKIYILISVINKKFPHTDEISPELYRYAAKLAEYKIIQRIERKLNEYAVDADIHRDIIIPDEQAATAAPDDIGALYYKPVFAVHPSKPSLATFFAYDYFEEEIRQIINVVKYLFYHTPVWKHDDLWQEVRNPPMRMEVNPELFQEVNFIIAMSNLTRPKQIIRRPAAATASTFFNTNQEFVKNGKYYRIIIQGEYYVAFPLETVKPQLVTIDSNYVKDKEQTLIDSMNAKIIMSVDAETYLRGVVEKPIMVSLADYVPSYESIYENDLNKYIAADNYKSILMDFSVSFQMRFLENYIEAYRINGAHGMETAPETVAFTIENSLKSFYTSRLASKTFKYLSLFGMVINAGHIRKYKDVLKKVELGNLPDNTPTGYSSTKILRIFDGNKWLEISKVDMNFEFSFKENEIVIGVLEPVGDRVVFKLRTPIHHIKTKYANFKQDRRTQHHDNLRAKKSASLRLTSGDSRTLERGINCETKARSDIMDIAANLGISLSALPREKLKSSTICQAIRESLLDSEIKERVKRSPLKYVYGWWNNVINVSAHV
jgi:hypothetical protein